MYWSASDIPHRSIPSIHSEIYGIFRIVDARVDDKTMDDESGGFVDVAFGSDSGRFAGSHRLTVRRQKLESGESAVTLGLSCITCNPTSTAPLNHVFLLAFHKVYATLLLSAAVSRVEDAILRESMN